MSKDIYDDMCSAVKGQPELKAWQKFLQEHRELSDDLAKFDDIDYAYRILTSELCGFVAGFREGRKYEGDMGDG